MLHKDIPGYLRAQSRGTRLAESWRELAFLSTIETLCGVQVRQLSLRMFAELCRARSPFLCGGSIGGEDVVLFLWRLSPGFDRLDADRRARFVESVHPLAYERDRFHRSVRSIKRFVNRMLVDKPPSSGGSNSISDVSFVGAFVHEFASAYGWDEDQILDKPLPQLFQLLRQILRDRNPKLPRFNPIAARLTRRVVDRHRARKAKETPCQPAAS